MATLYSCKSGNKLFNKRKYTNGVYLAHKTNIKAPNEKKVVKNNKQNLDLKTVNVNNEVASKNNFVIVNNTIDKKELNEVTTINLLALKSNNAQAHKIDKNAITVLTAKTINPFKVKHVFKKITLKKAADERVKNPARKKLVNIAWLCFLWAFIFVIIAVAGSELLIAFLIVGNIFYLLWIILGILALTKPKYIDGVAQPDKTNTTNDSKTKYQNE
jgi:hypothetical protein